MSFDWRKAKGGKWELVHKAHDGSENIVDFALVPEYVATLHASERQSPVPPLPVEAAIEAANDDAIRAAAASRPDALVASVTDSLARALAACEVATAAEGLAESLASQAAQAAARAQGAADAARRAVAELQAVAADLSRAAT